MANLDFYAVGDDLRDLIRFIFAESDIIIFEHSSKFDCEVRQFQSLSELEAVFQLGSYRAGYLQLWSRSVMTQPVIRRIELTGISGNTFRYTVEGSGLIQLYLNGVQGGIIHHTHYGHWKEAGARARSIHPAEACNWSALAKLSGRIQRHVRKHAVAKIYARPILHHAFNAVQQGSGLWFGPAIHHADSSDIHKIPA